MQTSTNNQSSASPQGLETRFALARAFFLDRGVKYKESVFAAFGFDLGDRSKYFDLLWNGRARVKPEDEAMVNAVEVIVEQLKNAPEIAA